MKAGKAFGAGVFGAVVMSILMFFGRLTGLTSLNLEMANGSLLTADLDARTWLLGFSMHLIAGGVFALVYAWFFERAHRAGAAAGLKYSVVHVLIAGTLVMGMMPAMHPLIPQVLPAPGFFALNYGLLTAVFFVAAHLVYGAIVGSFYGPAYRVRIIETHDEHRRKRAA